MNLMSQFVCACVICNNYSLTTIQSFVDVGNSMKFILVLLHLLHGFVPFSYMKLY